MKSLKIGGKAAIVVPEGVLFQTNNAFKQVKAELLDNFNLHTILSLPAGVFLPYSGVKTNVIFFDRTGGTTETWYYECEPDEKLTKNKPITDAHLAEFIELYRKRTTSPQSWSVSVDALKTDYDLSAKNPAKQTDIDHMPPAEILKLIQDEDQQVQALLTEIGGLLGEKP